MSVHLVICYSRCTKWTLTFNAPDNLDILVCFFGALLSIVYPPLGCSFSFLPVFHNKLFTVLNPQEFRVPSSTFQFPACTLETFLTWAWFSKWSSQRGMVALATNAYAVSEAVARVSRIWKVDSPSFCSCSQTYGSRSRDDKQMEEQSTHETRL